VELRAVVDAAVETAWPLLEAKQHRLDVKLPEEPVQLMVDSVRIAQVLSNLLSNAAKYTDPGGHIVLSAQVAAAQLRISVRDDGIGLSKQHLEEIFGMFSQVASASGRAQGGLGIGLALSRGLVQMHGGTLEASSAGPGQGSEFTVNLPLAMAASEAPGQAAPDTAGKQQEPQRAQRRVLIADDNADALMTMATLLEFEGHEVHTAADGEQALQSADTLRPDIAILDIGMPGLSGHQVAERIRATDWGKKVRLIALTGWGQADDQARARAAGFDHHCTKPVDLAELLSLLG
jgi:CheY-like chemotaxis protein